MNSGKFVVQAAPVDLWRADRKSRSISGCSGLHPLTVVCLWYTKSSRFECDLFAVWASAL